MLTLPDALNGSMFHHATLKNRDGSPLRARRNGKTQTWKTRPLAFRIPCKYGLYDAVQIRESDASQWVKAY